MDIKKYLPGVKENISLAEYTTFKIGGPARYFLTVENKEELVKAIKTAKGFKLPFFVLGNGSNILFSDEGFNGLVIKVANRQLRITDNEILAGAGVRLDELAGFSQENSLAGFEWLAGIPGTVGGAVYGNAQAFSARMSDLMKNVQVLDIKTLEIKNLSSKECQFSVKNSIFKKNKNLIIVSVVFTFEKGDKKEIQKKIKEFLDYRRESQPLNYSSAGSVFINPDNEPAGSLIDKCGLKGEKIGRAQISEKHANFIVNLGGAKSKDVLALIKLAKEKVKNKFGIELKEEINVVKPD